MCSPCETIPHSISRMRMASRTRMAASRFRRLSMCCFCSSSGRVSCRGAGRGRLRVSSSVYSREVSALNSWGTVWMRSTGFSFRPSQSTSERYSGTDGSNVRARGFESDTSRCAAGTGLCPQTIR